MCLLLRPDGGGRPQLLPELRHPIYEMLSDSVRTSHRDALVKNPDRLRDALVLDILVVDWHLSMFAAQAGAKAVVGVDCSDIIYQAKIS